MHGWPWAAAALRHAGAAAFGGVRRPAASRRSNKLSASSARTFEKARADGTFGKARAKRTFGKVPKPNIEIVRDARSTMKEFRERLHRDQNSTQGAHRSSSEKLFKEALQRSSSEKLFTKKQEKSAFIAVHGSAIEGGCCDSNATVHAR